MKRSLPSRLRRLEGALLDLPLDEPMLLSELDGFLTGLLICPEVVPPHEWLQTVWGLDDGDVPPFDDPLDVQWFVDAVLAQQQAIARDLARGKPQPIFDVDERNGEILWELWVDGFAAAMDLRPDGWTVLAETGASDAVAGMADLIAIARGESALDSMQINALQDRVPSEVLDLARRLYTARMQIGGAPVVAPAVDRPVKPGRNDPCHCGSGQKFKRCCAG